MTVTPTPKEMSTTVSYPLIAVNRTYQTPNDTTTSSSIPSGTTRIVCGQCGYQSAMVEGIRFCGKCGTSYTTTTTADVDAPNNVVATYASLPPPPYKENANVNSYTDEGMITAAPSIPIIAGGATVDVVNSSSPPYHHNNVYDVMK